MLKQTLMAAAIALSSMAAHADFTEGFEGAGAPAGWVVLNESSPIGSVTEGWFKGSDILTAQAGSADSYFASNFNAAADTAGATISTWLITQAFSTENAGTASFWARADIADGYFDQIRFGLNSSDSSDTSSFVLSSLTTVSGEWTQYTVSFDAMGAGSQARFAIEYTGLAAEANYVGIDTVAVTTVAAIPEPSTYALMGAGLMGLAFVTRRARAKRANA